MRSRRSYVSCGNCLTNYAATGDDPRCPACGARLADYEPGEPRPAVGRPRRLEDPDLRREEAAQETAPAEEFAAAGLVLLAFIMMVAGVAVRSPSLLTAGMAVFAVTGVFFGIYKLRNLASRRRRDDLDDNPSMLDWLIGRGFWGGRR